MLYAAIYWEIEFLENSRESSDVCRPVARQKCLNRNWWIGCTFCNFLIDLPQGLTVKHPGSVLKPPHPSLWSHHMMAKDLMTWASPFTQVGFELFHFPPRAELPFCALNSCRLPWHITGSGSREFSAVNPGKLQRVQGLHKYLLYNGKQGWTLKIWNMCHYWQKQF